MVREGGCGVCERSDGKLLRTTVCYNPEREATSPAKDAGFAGDFAGCRIQADFALGMFGAELPIWA